MFTLPSVEQRVHGGLLALDRDFVKSGIRTIAGSLSNNG